MNLFPWTILRQDEETRNLNNFLFIGKFLHCRSFQLALKCNDTYSTGYLNVEPVGDEDSKSSVQLFFGATVPHEAPASEEFDDFSLKRVWHGGHSEFSEISDLLLAGCDFFWSKLGYYGCKFISAVNPSHLEHGPLAAPSFPPLPRVVAQVA